MSIDAIGGTKAVFDGLQLPLGPAHALRRKESDVAPRVRSGPGRGTMILADISGYTAFLRAVAQAHAADMAPVRLYPRLIRCWAACSTASSNGSLRRS
jgi:hypothetical protein